MVRYTVFLALNENLGVQNRKKSQPENECEKITGASHMGA